MRNHTSIGGSNEMFAYVYKLYNCNSTVYIDAIMSA